MTSLHARRFGAVNALGTLTLYRRDVLRAFDIWGITIVAPALQSVLFALVFRLALGETSVTMGGIDFATFLIPGLVAYTALERGFESTGFMMVFDKLEGVIGDVLTAPLTSAEIVLAYGLMAASTAVITGTATGIALFPFTATLPAAPLTLLAFTFFGGLMLGLLGLLAGLWADKWDHISAVQTFVVIPAIFMSGVFFSLDRLPDALRAVAELNPVYYVIDGIRYGMTGQAGADPAAGILVVIAINTVLWLICWRLLVSGYKLKS